MSCIFNEIHLTKEEFTKQFDDIINSIDQTSSTVWIVDHKIVLIPYTLFESLNNTGKNNEFQGKLQSADH
jgi:hypothetical protein